jgi:ABC-type cobalt transport system substrate-binding protein
LPRISPLAPLSPLVVPRGPYRSLRVSKPHPATVGPCDLSVSPSWAFFPSVQVALAGNPRTLSRYDPDFRVTGERLVRMQYRVASGDSLVFVAIVFVVIMAAMPTVHKNMHYWAGQQKQKRKVIQSATQMRPVFHNEEMPNDKPISTIFALESVLCSRLRCVPCCTVLFMSCPFILFNWRQRHCLDNRGTYRTN